MSSSESESESGAQQQPVPEERVNELLAAASPGDRATGVNYVRYFEAPKRYETLLAMLRDPDVQVRYASVTQLATAGEHDRARTLEEMRAIIWREEEDPSVRAAAADVMGGLRMREALPDLEKLFRESSDWVVRFSVVAALGELGDVAAFELLQEALHSSAGGKEPLVQLAAIGSLGELGDERARALLEPLRESGDTSVVERAKIALETLDATQGRQG